MAALRPARLRAAGASLPNAVTPPVCRGQGLFFNAFNAVYFAMSAALRPAPSDAGAWGPAQVLPTLRTVRLTLGTRPHIAALVSLRTPSEICVTFSAASESAMTEPGGLQRTMSCVRACRAYVQGVHAGVSEYVCGHVCERE